MSIAGPTSEIPQVARPSSPIAPGVPEASGSASTTPTAPAPATADAPSVRASRSKKAGKDSASAPSAPHAGGRSRGSSAALIGGMPKVDLLPLSIRVLDKQKRSRRIMRAAALGVAIVVAAGTGAAWYLNMDAQVKLMAVQAEATSLLQQKASYSDLVTTQQQIELTTAAEAVGGATDVDWRAYLTQLQATLPAGVVLKTIAVDAAAPGAIYEQSTTPLEGSRIATLTFAATSPTLPDIPNWLDGLRTLPAFVDATPNSVRLDDVDGVYVVDITMHVNADAYSNRYAPTGTDGQ